MADTTCPKCRQKSDDPAACPKCGINFNEYAAQKHEKLSEVSLLLSEGKFVEAKQIADRLPLDFPDNRNDFLLLLSNINRDISIIEKCKLAQQCFDDGDYVQASHLLRNIKAFDKKLNEKVIILRRKIERHAQSGDTFGKAVEAFDKGNYGVAEGLFGKVEDKSYRKMITGYLQKIEEIRDSQLMNAVLSLKESKLQEAVSKFEALRAIFPDFKYVIESYLAVVEKRAEIQNNILDAAHKALEDKRYLEAKVLYLFLSIRFPDTRPQAQIHIREIGGKAVVTFTDLNEYGVVDLADLGLDADIDGSVEFLAVPEHIRTDSPTGPVPDLIDAGGPGFDMDERSKEAIIDTIGVPSDFGGVEVADFVF